MDSSSRQYGMFAADSRRRRRWAAPDRSSPAHVDPGGGMDRTGRSGSSRLGRRRILDDRHARVDRGSGGALDRSGRDAVAGFGSSGGGFGAGAIARPVPDPAHGTSRERCLCSGAGRRRSPARTAATRGRAAREDRVSARPRSSRARTRLSHDGARRRRRDLEQLHGHSRRAQGGRAAGPDLRRRRRPRATFRVA